MGENSEIISKSYLSLYITDRIKKYLISSNSSMLGLTLFMSNPLGGITFGSSRHFKRPFIQVSFQDENCNTSPVDKNSLFLKRKIANESLLINNLDPIPFKEDCITGKELISFDSASGYFIVNSMGSYFIQWSVTVSQAHNLKKLSFALLDDCGNTLSAISTSVALPLTIEGSTLLNLNKNKYKFTIINTSGGSLNLTSKSTANSYLEIIKV